MNAVNRTAAHGSLIASPTGDRSVEHVAKDVPWPVTARNLLTKREQSLYHSLIRLFPEHKIFIQVALSQLIDVAKHNPERQSIRARFKQLVADFVLCRADLSVVAVIELDDATHQRPVRQAADARKTKALRDAGIRLARVPAGPLPSEAELRKLICPEGKPLDPSNPTLVSRSISVDPELVADDYERTEMSTSAFSRAFAHEELEARALKAPVRKLILAGVLIVGGWIVYSYLLSTAKPAGFVPSSVVATSRPVAVVAASAPLIIAPAVARPTREELAETKRLEMQAVLAARQQSEVLHKRKEQAWAAFYVSPASCEHPPTWKDQVECGNQFMRAKKLFEQRWQAQSDDGR